MVPIVICTVYVESSVSGSNSIPYNVRDTFCFYRIMPICRITETQLFSYPYSSVEDVLELIMNSKEVEEVKKETEMGNVLI